jgi:cytochrome c553
MDHWLLPVGAQAFKQFSRDGKRVETRLITRTGEGRFDYWMGAFIWNDDESDAVFVPEGRDNARDTEHDVPSVKQCGTCHNGERGRYLGVSALQLFGGPTFETLSERDLFSDPAARDVVYGPPGDPATKAALGYLHANCGHCHNPTGSSWPDTSMVLRLSVQENELEDTAIYLTTVNVEPQSFADAAYPFRIAPGDPEASALFFRMQQRARETQMPPFATELVDESGIQLIEGFISELDSAL